MYSKPLLYLLNESIITRSASHCSSIAPTITRFCLKRYLTGLCKVYVSCICSHERIFHSSIYDTWHRFLRRDIWNRRHQNLPAFLDCNTGFLGISLHRYPIRCLNHNFTTTTSRNTTYSPKYNYNGAIFVVNFYNSNPSSHFEGCCKINRTKIIDRHV